MKEFINKYKWEIILLAFLILEIIIFGTMNPRFLKLNVLLGSINDFLPICIISLFATFVMITGGIDIQAGSIVGLSSICFGLMWQELGLSIWLACLLAILIGCLCGLLSGAIVATLDVQPMVITLGGSFLFSGLGLAIMSLAGIEAYKGISGFPKVFTQLFRGRFGPVPYQVILFIVLIIVAYLILHRSKYGRTVFLTGVNRNTAEYSGINTKLVIASTYVLSGASAALAGIVLTGYLGTAKSDFGKELTLPIITAIVLGGTSNTGGRGNIVGTALAAVVIGIMRFGLSMNGVDTQYLDIPVGVLLIFSLVVRTLLSKNKR